MKKIVILAAPGFEEIELFAPLDILRRLGFEVILAGVQAELVTGAHHATIQTDTTLDKIQPHTVDAVILPGGAGSWVLRDSPAVMHFIQEVHAAGHLVAAICAAPIALAQAGLIRGKRVTAYPAEPVYQALQEAILEKHQDLVLDGHIMTAKGPGAAMLFGYAIGEYLGEDLQVAELKEQMCYREA